MERPSRQAAPENERPPAPVPGDPDLDALRAAHPSSILRVRDTAARGEAMEHFIDDLQEVAGWLHAKS